MRNRRHSLGVNDPQILIANALVNLDPTSLVTSGSNVTGWNSIGRVAGYSMTAVGALTTSTLNGYTVPQSAGVGYMTADVEPQTNQPNTLIVVAKPGVDPTTATLPLCDGADGPGERHLLRSGTTTGYPLAYAGTSLILSQALDTNTRVWSAVFNGASSRLTVHGLGTVTGNVGSEPFSFALLFADAGGPTAIYNGQIAQFLWFDWALTESQETSLYRFLKAKFAAA